MQISNRNLQRRQTPEEQLLRVVTAVADRRTDLVTLKYSMMKDPRGPNGTWAAHFGDSGPNLALSYAGPYDGYT